MSTMLEQAIIDAAALREAAMKSAEASLVEKYKPEFQETIEKLLEQEMEPETAAANAEDATGPIVAQDPTPQPVATAPMQDPNKKDVFSKVKSAFFDLDGDDEELVTISFDQLKAKPVDQNFSMPTSAPTMLATPETTSTETQPETMAESFELDLDELSEGLVVKIGERYDAGHREDQYGEEEEYEFELDESAASLSLKRDANALKQQASKKETDAVGMEAKEQEEFEKQQELEKKQKAAQESSQESSLEEEIELTEEELLELEEALSVDMEDVPGGYLGTTKREEREAKKVTYAKARDDKEVKKREWAKKNLSDLEEALERIGSMYVTEKSKRESAEKDNNNLLSAISALKEQLEQTNLSNAKLLYTNKVLSNVSLNERQKNSIVENITRAQSVNEAKTIYETLQSTVQSVQQKTPKSLSEALNRGPSPFLVRKTQQASINDLFSDRMKALAGIKKD